MALTQATIAKKLRLSRRAVGFALSEDPHSRKQVAEQTRRRILETAQALGYRPHRYAQIMRGKKSGLIGVIKPLLGMQTAIERSLFAARAIYASHYGLLANEIQWSEEGLTHAVDAMLDAQVEGVLLDGVTEEPASAELQRLREAKIPMVSLAGVRLDSIPFVAADYRQGMFDLTYHLLALGCRKLTHVSTLGSERDNAPGKFNLVERRTGFEQAATRTAFGESEARVLYRPLSSGSIDCYALGRATMRQLIESGERPDALLCSNDDMAIGVLAACSEAGLKVPEDIALTGFDNTTVGQYVRPPLTTVAQPTEALAKKAVELLLKRVRGETILASEELVKLPCQVVVRQSCGVAMGSRTK